MSILNNHKYRFHFMFLPLRNCIYKRWGWDTTETHWGYIISVSIGPIWILFNRFYNYKLAYGIKD